MFRLPRLKANLAIVNGQGKPIDYFLRFWNIDVVPLIERQEASQESTLAAIQAIQAQQAQQLELINDALELAGLALATADGGTPTKSGSATGTFSLSGTSFNTATTVALTSVSAGDLTIPGTGPTVSPSITAMTGGTVLNGEYQIIEIDNGVDNGTVFTGTFVVTDVTTDEPNQIFSINHVSASAVAAFLDARTTTGAISYRAEVRRVSGANMTGMRFYLFVRRAA
jgi:hypothetical protein